MAARPVNLDNLTERDRVVLKTTVSWMEQIYGGPVTPANAAHAFKATTTTKVGRLVDMSKGAVTQFIQTSDTFNGKNDHLLTYIILYLEAMAAYSADPWPDVKTSLKWGPPFKGTTADPVPAPTPDQEPTTGPQEPASATPAPEPDPEPTPTPDSGADVSPLQAIEHLLARQDYSGGAPAWFLNNRGRPIRCALSMASGQWGPFDTQANAQEAVAILSRIGAPMTPSTPAAVQAERRRWYVLDDGTPAHVDAQGLKRLTGCGRVSWGPFNTEQDAAAHYREHIAPKETTEAPPATAEESTEPAPTTAADPLDAVESFLEAAADRQRQATGANGPAEDPVVESAPRPRSRTTTGGKTSTERSRECRDRKRAEVQAEHQGQEFQELAQEFAGLRQWIDDQAGVCHGINDESELVAGIILHYLTMGNTRAGKRWLSEWTGEPEEIIKEKLRVATFARGRNWDAYVSEIIPNGSPLENIDTEHARANLDAMRRRLKESHGRLRAEFAAVEVPPDAPRARDGPAAATAPAPEQDTDREGPNDAYHEKLAALEARLEATERAAQEANAALEAEKQARAVLEARLVGFQARDRLEYCVEDGCLLAVDHQAGLYATPDDNGNPQIRKIKEGQVSFRITERLDLLIGNTTDDNAPGLGPTVEIREREAPAKGAKKGEGAGK